MEFATPPLAVLIPGQFLTRKQLARVLNASTKALENWALAGSGPKFIRISCRKVLYSSEEVLLWLKSLEVKSTSDRTERLTMNRAPSSL
jgi:hypothetical protein